MPIRRKSPREQAEAAEKKLLKRCATRSTNRRATRRQYPVEYEKDEFRTEFERDYTRIIHCRAFRRLRHKTQVFISPKNDHVCSRLEHSLHVASVAGTIARALRLNIDLVRAIAVGHDLGHAPFGHKGEKCLNKLLARYGLRFAHELHSLRVVDELESPYDEHKGLNLTFAVRDGIACHHGEGLEGTLRPQRDKDPATLLTMKRAEAMPATLEGCVVRWADRAAYLGRDLEDAVITGLLDVEDLPRDVKEHLGRDNPSIIGALVHNIVEHSTREKIAVSPEVAGALNEFNDFNVRRIYQNPKVTRYFPQVERAMRSMFREFVKLIKRAKERPHDDLFPNRKEHCIEILDDFLKNDERSWREQAPPQLAADFIAGMTDPFFISTFEELFLPKSTA
jgi:dGTPase